MSWETWHFAFSVTVPNLLMLLLGVLLRRLRLIDDAFCDSATRLVFSLSLPCLLFFSLAAHPPSPGEHLAFALYGGLATLVSFLLLEAVASRLVKNPRERGIFVQGGFRANTAIVGLAYCASAYGNPGVAIASLYMAITVILFNVLSVITLAVVRPQARQRKPENITRRGHQPAGRRHCVRAGLFCHGAPCAVCPAHHREFPVRSGPAAGLTVCRCQYRLTGNAERIRRGRLCLYRQTDCYSGINHPGGMGTGISGDDAGRTVPAHLHTHRCGQLCHDTGHGRKRHTGGQHNCADHRGFFFYHGAGALFLTGWRTDLTVSPAENTRFGSLYCQPAISTASTSIHVPAVSRAAGIISPSLQKWNAKKPVTTAGRYTIAESNLLHMLTTFILFSDFTTCER